MTQVYIIECLKLIVPLIRDSWADRDERLIKMMMISGSVCLDDKIREFMRDFCCALLCNRNSGLCGLEKAVNTRMSCLYGHKSHSEPVTYIFGSFLFILKWCVKRVTQIKRTQLSVLFGSANEI